MVSSSVVGGIDFLGLFWGVDFEDLPSRIIGIDSCGACLRN